MNLRFVDWIWHVRGSLALAPSQSSDDAFDRLDPLFRETGTVRQRQGDALTFSKKNPAAQDRMAVFDEGVLQVEPEEGGRVLRYSLTSRMLLYCFLAPLFFLAFAQFAIALDKYQKPTTPAEIAAAKAEKEKKKAEKEKLAAMPLNPIDQFLGAPAPEKPKKDEKKDKKDEDKPFFPKAAYVFAGIFATLYLVGRILEAWLVKSLFRRKLLDV